MKTKPVLLLLIILGLGGSLRAQVNSARMISGVKYVPTANCPYPIIASDTTVLLTFTGTGNCAVTLPSSTALGFGAGTIFSVRNQSSATVTITPTSGTIGGNANLVLTPQQGADIYGDGVNYGLQPGAGTSGGGGGGGAPPFGAIGQLQTNSGGGLFGASSLNETGSKIVGTEPLQVPQIGNAAAGTYAYLNGITFLGSQFGLYAGSGAALPTPSGGNSTGWGFPGPDGVPQQFDGTAMRSQSSRGGASSAFTAGHLLCVGVPYYEDVDCGTLGTVTGFNFLKPDPNSAIRYVAGKCSGGAACTDANDGLSWGTAKLTISAACQVLPNGSAGACGGGTIYVGNGAIANAAGSQYGIMLMGNADPNFASPPTGWLKCGASPNFCSLNIIGMQSSNQGANGHMGRVFVIGGSASDRNHPGIWLSAPWGPVNIQNLAFGSNGREFVVGECSNGDRTGTCATATQTLDNNSGGVSQTAANGPCTDITGGSFWIYVRNESCSGNAISATGTFTANNAAAILVDGGTNVGNGFIYIEDSNLSTGGIKVIPGTSGGSVFVSNTTEEGDFTHTMPATLWITSVGNVPPIEGNALGLQLADSTGGAVAYQNDEVGSGFAVLDTNGAIGSGVILNQTNASANTTSPLRYHQQGFFNGYMVGETDVARRISGLSPGRFVNKANNDNTTWLYTGGSPTITSQPDPYGGNTATNITTITGVSQNAQLGACVAYTPATGDWIVGGTWEQGMNVGQNNLYAGCNGVGQLTPSIRYANFGMETGTAGDWTFRWFAEKEVTGGATSMGLQTQFSNTLSPTIYGPVLYIIPAGTLTDNEVLEFASSMNSVDFNCPAGSSCAVKGHPITASNLEPSGSNFYISTSCNGQANCLQWVDDNTTDNCGAATTAFMTKINAYNGVAQLWIQGSGAGTTARYFKLATAGCHLEFDKYVNVHLWGNINCAQPATTANCIQVGLTGQSSFQAAQIDLDGGGQIIGGANLTNAVIEIEPWVAQSLISNIVMTNVGAGASLGSCTNWAILLDGSIAEATIQNIQYGSTDSTVGRCAFSNSSGAVNGFNTIFFKDNILGGEGTGAACSSVGIADGGSYGSTVDNNIFGFKQNILLTGIGHYVAGNQLDTGTGTSCASPATNALIQWGSGTTGVGEATIIGNKVGGAPNGSTVLFGKAPGVSTGTLRNISLIGNTAAGNTGTPPTGISLTDASSCGGSASANSYCYIYGNTNLTLNYSCNTTSQGWSVDGALAACANSALTANLGSTVIVPATATFLGSYTFLCDVLLTTAATTSSTLPQCQITYTNAFTNATETDTVTPAWASGTPGCAGSTTNTVGNRCSAAVLIIPKAATAINIQTTGYASVGGTAMQYQVFSKLRQ